MPVPKILLPVLLIALALFLAGCTTIGSALKDTQDSLTKGVADVLQAGGSPDGEPGTPRDQCICEDGTPPGSCSRNYGSAWCSDIPPDLCDCELLLCDSRCPCPPERPFCVEGFCYGECPAGQSCEVHGTCSDPCEGNEVCCTDADCDDGDGATNDSCQNPATEYAYCVNTADFCSGKNSRNGGFETERFKPLVTKNWTDFSSLQPIVPMQPVAQDESEKEKPKSSQSPGVLVRIPNVSGSQLKSALEGKINEISRKNPAIGPKPVVQWVSKLFGLALVFGNPRSIQELSKNGVQVFENPKVQAALSDAIPLIRAPEAWQDNFQNTYFRGDGQLIAVADTGIDYTHSQLGNCTQEQVVAGLCTKIPYAYNFIDGTRNPLDDHGHGTLVSGIIAADCPNGEIFWNGQCLEDYGARLGVAPKAKLMVLKVLDNEGGGYESDLIAALEMALDPNGDGSTCDHASVFNLSASGEVMSYWVWPTGALALAVKRAVGNGMVVVMPMPSYSQGYSFGTATEAIVAGGSYKIDNPENNIPQRHGRGPQWLNYLGYEDNMFNWTKPNSWSFVKPDLVAPNYPSICSTRWELGGEYNACREDDPARREYAELGRWEDPGNSASTAFASGTAALVRQANYQLDPNGVRFILKNTATELANYEPNDQGYGRIDAKKATDWARNQLLAPEGGKLPIIQLEPLKMRSRGTITIIAKIINFGSIPPSSEFKLEYKKSGSTQWIQEAVSPGQGALNFTIDTGSLTRFMDGKYYFRVSYTNNDQTVSDMVYTEIDNVYFNRPLQEDTENANHLIEIWGGVPSDIALDYDLYWREAFLLTAPWRTTGLTKTGYCGIGSCELGSLDPVIVEIKDQAIELKLVRKINGDSEIITFYADNSLRDGFPIRVERVTEFETVNDDYYNWDSIPPAVFDIDNDSKNDIIAFQRIKVTAESPWWNYKTDILVLGDRTYSFRIPQIIGNVTGIAFGTDSAGKNFAIITGYYNTYKLAEQNGELALNYFTYTWNNHKPVAADLDRDGNPEIIFFSDSYVYHSTEYPNQCDLVLPDPLGGYNCYHGKLNVVNLNGEELAGWPKVFYYGYPSQGKGGIAIGNFDSDSDFEIAAVAPKEPMLSGSMGCYYCFNENTLRVSVFNLDGSSVGAWPVEMDEYITSNPVTTHLNQDGKQEILFSSQSTDYKTGFVHALSTPQSEASGWPYSERFTWFGEPSISNTGIIGTRRILVTQDNQLISLDYTGRPTAFNTQGLSNAQAITTGSPSWQAFLPQWSCPLSPETFSCQNAQKIDLTANTSTLFGIVEDSTANQPFALASLYNEANVSLLAYQQYAWDDFKEEPKYRQKIFAWQTTYPMGSENWPEFQHDPGKTGCFDCAS